MGVTGDFVGRVTETGQDPHGLGRWSYVRLGGTNGKQTYIITAYRVSQDSNSSGDTTAHKQQVRLLRKRGINNPKPREQWCIDMEKQTAEWIVQGASVLLMVDANSPLNDAGFAKFVANSTLGDLLGSKHGMDSPP
eukprot:scaffold15916_cov59-Attheya_sp.AAC.1